MWFIQSALSALMMAGVAAWISKARKKSVVSGGELVMRFPRSAMVLALFCVIVSAGLVALTFVVPRQNAPWWAVAGFGIAALASIHFLVDTWVGRYHLTPEGMRYVSVFRGERLFRWDEIKSFSYSTGLHWFVLRNSRGDVARISVMMIGLPAFARLLMERARNVDIDPASIPILKQTASGAPPDMGF